MLPFVSEEFWQAVRTMGKRIYPGGKESVAAEKRNSGIAAVCLIRVGKRSKSPMKKTLSKELAA